MLLWISIAFLWMVSIVLGQIEINLPSGIPSCRTVRIDWTGGLPLYNVSIFAGPSELNETLRHTFFSSEPYLNWEVILPPDTQILVSVTDSTGVSASSRSTVVQPGPGTSSCPPELVPASSAAANTSRPSSIKTMKGAIAGGVFAALVVCAFIVLAVTLIVRRRQRTYLLPVSSTPTLSSRRSNAAAAAVTRSVYTKARESQLERELYALKEQMDTLKRHTTASGQIDYPPGLSVGDVEREMVMLKRQMEGVREEMSELRVEREALRGLGCGSDISCRSDSF